MRRVWWLTTILAGAVAGALPMVQAGNAQEMGVAANGRCPPGVPPIVPSARLDRVPLGEPRFAQEMRGQGIRPEVFELTCIAPAGEATVADRGFGIEAAGPRFAAPAMDTGSGLGPGLGLGTVGFPAFGLSSPVRDELAVPLGAVRPDAIVTPEPPIRLP